MLDKQEIIKKVQKNLPKYRYDSNVMLYKYKDKENPRLPWRSEKYYDRPNVAQAVEFILRMLEDDEA